MSMAIVGVAGAVVAAGSAAYGAYSKGEAEKDAANSRVPSDSLIARAAGTVPKAAEYMPVDFSKEQLAGIGANQGALQSAIDLSRGTNNFLTNDALRRISKMVPGYSAAMQKMGMNANNLLSGRLPFNDVLGIAGDQSGLTASLGIPGTAGPATMRDLGLSELQGIQAGGGMLKDMIGMAEAINPIGRSLTPQSMFVAPTDRLKMTMEQNQLVQQSNQNKNNLEAQGDPEARLRLGLQTSGALSGYTGPDPGMTAINTGIGSLGSMAAGMGGMGGMGGGGGGMGGLGSLFGGGGGAGGQPNASGFFNTQAGAQNYYSRGASGYSPQVAYYGGTGQPGANSGWYLQYYTGGAGAAAA